MRQFFDYELVFLPGASDHRLRLLWSYVVNSFRTMAVLLRNRPSVVWIQLAPVFPLYIAMLYRLMQPGSLVVADCHNSMFRPRWARLPLAITLLNRCFAVLVHSSMVRDSALSLGIDSALLYVLEDRPAQLECASTIAADGPRTFGERWVFIPSSFDDDEPVSEILEAARRMPDVRFIVTGDVARAVRTHDLSGAPENVELTGFIERRLFDRYLCAAPVVMGLTTRNNIQLCVANEAVGAGRAMVISDTPLLRSMFHQGAVYVQANSDSIVAGVQRAFEERSRLERETRELRDWREQRWMEQAQGLKERLGRAIDRLHA